jgi:hypothetical protein
MSRVAAANTMDSQNTAPAPQAGQSDGQRGASHVGSGDLVGLGYRGSDGAMTCALCDYEMEWRDCDHCCGDGYLDGYEDDPINYAPGEDVPCHMCGGNGGEWICETKECRTVVCTRIAKNGKPNNEVTHG